MVPNIALWVWGARTLKDASFYLFNTIKAYYSITLVDYTL